MKPSERIKLISSVAGALGKENASLVNLTLKQFSLPWSSTWTGFDPEDYVINQISESNDNVLVDLAKHLGLVTELESTKSPTFWKEEDVRIFLSHISASKNEAGIIKEELEELGVRCFVAHDDIEPTKEWQSEIELALTTMDALIALLSPGFKESKWTDQEVGVAIGRRLPIVPLKHGLDPYGFIGKYQALSVSGKKGTVVAAEIVSLLATKPQMATRISRALVERIKTSDSWAESKKLIDLIEKCSQFTEKAISDLKKAVESNSQIRGAWGVPERISKLVAAHGG